MRYDLPTGRFDYSSGSAAQHSHDRFRELQQRMSFRSRFSERHDQKLRVDNGLLDISKDMDALAYT